MGWWATCRWVSCRWSVGWLKTCWWVGGRWSVGWWRNCWWVCGRLSVFGGLPMIGGFVIRRKDLHLYLKFHSGTVTSFCLCKSTTWFLRKWKIDAEWVIQNNEWVKKFQGLLQTAPLTITWFTVPFKNRNS